MPSNPLVFGGWPGIYSNHDNAHRNRVGRFIAHPAFEKQELMLFLAAQLRAEGAAPPEPRTFTREQVDVWIEQDEVDMRRLREQG